MTAPADSDLREAALGIFTVERSSGIDWEWRDAITAAAGRMGLTTARVTRPEDVAAIQTLLVVGYPAAAADLLAASGPRRRILWSGEPVLRPGPSSRGALRRRTTRLGASPLLHRLRAPLRPLVRSARLPAPLGRVRDEARAEHERALNLWQVQRLAPLLDRLAVTNFAARDALMTAGIAADVVPFGYEPAVAGPLAAAACDRDIAMVAIGQLSRQAGWRRSKLIRLAAVDPDLRVAEGVWGTARNELLRRARVMLNVQRVPGTYVGYRVILALAAGSVLVTEPMDDPRPFEPGVHYVEAPLERLLAEARALLADEPRRRRIVEAGQALLTGPLAMETSLAQLLG